MYSNNLKENLSSDEDTKYVKSFHNITLRIAALALLGGCVKHDIGDACPDLLDGIDPVDKVGTRTITQEVVGQNIEYPCEEMICVASEGRDGYCSRKCLSDAGCPAGFTCRTVQETGFFADEKFCVWKHCETPSDCGNEKKFCCSIVPGAEPVGELKLCEYALEKECG